MIRAHVIKTLRGAIATVLLLAAGNALALGLGQIEVKSRINQPLLAEIPIVSTTPGELQALQARLASPDTFRRVGLEPPQGIAADLRFSLGNDARGRPVIRVTTTAPVNQAVLNFLIEVDWGQGRLVREYSALIDAPRTASAPLQPAINAPVVAAPNVVQRPAASLPPAALPPPRITTAPLPPSAGDIARAPAAEPTSSPMPMAEPAPASSAIAPPREVVRPQPASAPPVARTPSQYGPVKAGETLSKIASGLSDLNPTDAYSLDQTMLALLRANPDAFLDDNINLLRQGAVLRVPGSTDRASISADDAQRVVREQMQQWRQARQPIVQPHSVIAGDAAGSTRSKPADVASKPVTTTAAAPAKATAKPVVAAKPAIPAIPAKAPQRAQARLEIVPAAIAGKATGIRSGTNAGGEGSMLQQQLQQRDEDLAARKAEIGELKERVAELETLKQQQAQLLSMKDSELAAAQQRLANARTAQAKPAVSAATQANQSAQPAKEPPPQANPLMPWLWGGLLVIGLGVLAWLFARRRSAPVTPSPRRRFDSEALAASMPSPLASAPHATDADLETDAADVEPVLERPDGPTVATGAAAQAINLAEVRTAPVAHVETPAWHSGQRVKNTPAVDASAPSLAGIPSFIPPGAVAQSVQADAARVEPVVQPASAEQRMKLARAFLDIGDDHSARQLLVELKEGAANPLLRTEASKLLRDLG